MNSLKRRAEEQRELGNLGANILFLKKTNIINKNQKILEIGCGKGSLLHFLLSKNCDIMGIEIADNVIKESRRIYGNLPIIKMSGDDLKFKDNSFDIVLSFDVFEHIPNVDKHLQEVKRVLKEGGHYLLGTPNKWTNIPWEILRTKSFMYKDKADHWSLQTYWGIKKRFAKNGFEIRFVEVPVSNEFMLRKVEKTLGVLGLLLYRIYSPDRMPTPLRTNFYIVARSNELMPEMQFEEFKGYPRKFGV